MISYLTDLPHIDSVYGLNKVLFVRKESIHLKHILTEIFVRKTIDIYKYLNVTGQSLFDYVEIMTNRFRTIYKFPRAIDNDMNDIVNHSWSRFFPSIELCRNLNTTVVLDFDGVVTEKNFSELYELCIQRCGSVQICSANPTITNEWFIKRGLTLPNKIHSMKGKVKKIKRLVELSKKYDMVFYVDNEPEYLEHAWIYGVKTYHWTKNKIKEYSLNNK